MAVDNLRTGESQIIVLKGNWFDWVFGSNAACSDARHIVGGKPREQTEQMPESFYFGEKPVPKKEYNKLFTIVGISPAKVKSLLAKAEGGEKLTDWEAHNVAAVMLSTYYYCHHEWPNYKQLEAMIKK